MAYKSFLKSVFGNQYAVHSPYLHGLNLYCLFVITLTISLCVYTLHQHQHVCDKTFKQRVHDLRVKYATTRRPDYD